MSDEVKKELVFGTNLFFYLVKLFLYIVEGRLTILRRFGNLAVSWGQRRSADIGIIKLELDLKELFDSLDVIYTFLEVLQRNMFAFLYSSWLITVIYIDTGK